LLVVSDTLNDFRFLSLRPLWFNHLFNRRANRTERYSRRIDALCLVEACEVCQPAPECLDERRLILRLVFQPESST
jgi:hypothetical protein